LAFKPGNAAPVGLHLLPGKVGAEVLPPGQRHPPVPHDGVGAFHEEVADGVRLYFRRPPAFYLHGILDLFLRAAFERSVNQLFIEDDCVPDPAGELVKGKGVIVFLLPFQAAA
jgi:hypothetical protein